VRPDHGADGWEADAAALSSRRSEGRSALTARLATVWPHLLECSLNGYA
jgi:hypothetical protein